MRQLAAAMVLACAVTSAAAQGDFEKGLSYYKQGQYAKAVQEFEKIVAASPKYESGFRILGDCYLKLKRYDQSIEAFQSALRLKNDLYFSYYGLSLAYYNSGRYRDSAATLLRAERHARSPRDRYQLFHLRGASYYNLGELERAVSDMRQALAIQRGNVQDLLMLGISYYRLGNYPDARKYLEQTLSADPDNGEARKFLSRMRYQEAVDAIAAGDYAGAARILLAYLADQPQDGEAWFNLGLAELFAENWANSERALLKSSRLLPDNWEAFDRLGFVYERTEQFQKSLDSYRKAAQLHSDPRIQESIERIQERIRRQSQK